MPSIFANSLTYSNSIGLGDAALTLQTSLGPVLSPWQSVSSLVCAAPVAAIQLQINANSANINVNSTNIAANSTAFQTAINANSTHIAANSNAFIPLTGSAKITGAMSLTVTGAGCNITISGEGTTNFIAYGYNATANGPMTTARFSHGTMVAPTACSSGDSCGGMIGAFYDGVNSFHNVGQINFTLIDPNFATSLTCGAQIVFQVASIGGIANSKIATMDWTNGFQFMGASNPVIDANRYHILRGQTINAASATTQNSFATAFATNEGGIGQPIYFDGANWRRFSDCNVMSTGNKQPQTDFFVRSVPATGFTYTVANGVGQVVLDPAGTLATGALTMCASPFDGQEMGLSTSQIITAFTLSGNTGQTLDGGFAAATLAANGFARYKWVNASTTWYRIG